jgi:hypothetical protein
MITIAVSYDDAGRITVSESGGDPSYFSGWQMFDLSLTGPHTSQISVADLGETYPGGQCLTDSAVGGALCPQTAMSADRSTITYVWADPQLANQGYTFVGISPSDVWDNMCGCHLPSTGSFYFPGYAPYVSITSPGAQEAGYEIGPISPLQIDASVVGGADAETSGQEINAPGIAPEQRLLISRWRRKPRLGRAARFA